MERSQDGRSGVEVTLATLELFSNLFVLFVFFLVVFICLERRRARVLPGRRGSISMRVYHRNGTARERGGNGGKKDNRTGRESDVCSPGD